MTLTKRGDDQFPLRLPAGLRDEIKAAAAANGRTMNAEIVARIRFGEMPTLRDSFAMAAVTGFLTSNDQGAKEKLEIAGYAYDIADAMLEAREW